MRIYLAGPMTGKERYNEDVFDMAATHYRALGHEVFSPVEKDRKVFGLDTTKWPTYNNLAKARKVLGADLAWICDNADALVMLKGWEHSKGARVEWHLAVALGLEIYYWADKNARLLDRQPSQP